MPAYFLTSISASTVSDIYLMYSLRNIPTSILLTVPAAGAYVWNFITPVFYPNNSGCTTSNSTLELNYTTTNKYISVTPQLHRVDLTGGTIASGTAATAQVVATPNSFTLDEPDWNPTGCTDRLMLTLSYDNSHNTQPQQCVFETNDVHSYLLTTIPHNSGDCNVLREVAQFSNFRN